MATKLRFVGLDVHKDSIIRTTRFCKKPEALAKDCALAQW